MILRPLLVALVLLLQSRNATGQGPSRIDYILRVDPTDLSGVSVEMRIHGAPASFRLAMAWHTEYDDQYWRYLTDLHGTSTRGAVTVAREDSSLWRVSAPSGDVSIRYRVGYPASLPGQQAAWKAHLRATGGLIGGPHSFLYIVGAEHTPVHLALALPTGWDIATGLEPTSGKAEYTAAGAEALIDSPIMVGKFRRWTFAIDGVPHGIAYLGQLDGVPFDSNRFVSNVERMARESVRLMGWMPYRRFVFQFEDGAQGGLEHLNTITIGVQSAPTSRDPDSPLPQIAHEFFHVWNEVHLRPAAWIGLQHAPPAPSSELWWAEGVTLYYADLVMRRAGFQMTDSTRLAHLERLIATYTANPSQGMVSPEHTSREFNLPQGGNGDYTPSMYTQGEVIGTVLDLMIRQGSDGRRSLNDVMRELTRKFDPQHGFTDADVEGAVADACGCDARSFFETFVRKAGAIDFNRWLAVLGLRADVSWEPALAPDGTPAPDLRLLGYLRAGEHQPRLLIWFPSTLWGEAGFHTGDRLVSWNGREMGGSQELRTAIAQLRLGDSVHLAVSRDSGTFEATVIVRGYRRPVVHVVELPAATAAQKALRARWAARELGRSLGEVLRRPEFRARFFANTRASALRPG